MTSTIQRIDDKKFYQVIADLKGYRINQLKSMEETNSTLAIEIMNIKLIHLPFDHFVVFVAVKLELSSLSSS